jgi:hypothetical protein
VEAVDAEAPDAIVLDLGTDPARGIADVQGLRENRLYVGLPTFVLAGADLADQDREKLGGLLAVVVPREGAVPALDEVLGVLFPSGDSEKL